jgi:class 3 adenylate cyclase
VRGYSRLTEAQQLAFTEQVIGGFADVLAGCADAVAYAETAGDGLYVVFDHVVPAARAAAALHAVVSPARLAAAGLPAHLGLRLSAHVGPVFRVFDRVIGRERYCGAEVIRTARIEPVTPPGETYVSEQFAAALVCADAPAWSCDYVGIQPMAKDYGDCRMYALRPTSPPAPRGL